MENSIINSAWFVTLLAEVALIMFLEKRWWHTFITPTTCLAIPYLCIVLLAMCIGGHGGFVPFYSPSMLIWIVGLALMELCSGLCTALNRRLSNANAATIELKPMRHEALLDIVLSLLIVLFALHFRGQLAHSAYAIGSDEFGEEFATYGLFGHLMTLLLACLIVCFGLVRKGKKTLYIGIITAIVFFLFINQVKSWVIIPLIAGVILCLISGKLQFTMRLILLVIAAGLGLFSLSYIIVFAVVMGNAYNSDLVALVYKYIIHYLLSGVMGYSEICRQNLIDIPNASALFAPFVNIWNSLTGQPTVSPINPHFLIVNPEHGLGTNIRTLFGTIYIYGGSVVFIVYTLFLGMICYLMRIFAIRSHSMYILACDAWFCALLFMGWFECYTFHLRTIEVPVILIMLYLASCVRWKRKEVVC